MVIMKEINIPTECRDTISKYDMRQGEILWYALKGILKPNGNPKRGYEKPFGMNQELVEKHISEMETDGLIERVTTKKLHLIPKEILRPTEKGRYVLYLLLDSSYKNALDDLGSTEKATSWHALSKMNDECGMIIQRDKAEYVARTLQA
jgi:hypothetical protein